MGLGHRMDNFPAQLSGGEQQPVYYNPSAGETQPDGGKIQDLFKDSGSFLPIPPEYAPPFQVVVD